MLKTLAKRHNSQKFELAVDHAVEYPKGTTERDLEDSLQMHYIVVHNVASKLGFKPRRLSVGLYTDGVKARGIVRAKSAEDVATLITAINRRVAGLSSIRPASAAPARQSQLLRAA